MNVSGGFPNRAATQLPLTKEEKYKEEKKKQKARK
jgi:hypothetical protein